MCICKFEPSNVKNVPLVAYSVLGQQFQSPFKNTISYTKRELQFMEYIRIVCNNFWKTLNLQSKHCTDNITLVFRSFQSFSMMLSDAMQALQYIMFMYAAPPAQQYIIHKHVIALHGPTFSISSTSSEQHELYFSIIAQGNTWVRCGSCLTSDGRSCTFLGSQDYGYGRMVLYFFWISRLQLQWNGLPKKLHQELA